MSASYHVSDHLNSRHPYEESTGFRALAKRDQSKLFNGFGLASLEHNIASLTSAEVTVENKLEVMRTLLAHLAKAETKLRCLKFGIVASLKWLVDANLGPTMDELSCLALRSLAAVPNSMLAVYHGHAVPSILTVLQGREGKDEEAEMRAREAAGEALQLLTVGWSAKWLLLGEDLPDFIASPDSCPTSADDSQERLKLGKTVVEALCGILQAFTAGEVARRKPSLPLLRSALQAFLNLSSNEAGVGLCLSCELLAQVDLLLLHYSNSPAKWIGTSVPEVQLAETVVKLAVTAVWNVCMDPRGKQLTQALPFSLGKLLLAAAQFPMKHLEAKAAISGALCAIFISEQVKHAGVEPLLSSAEQAVAYGVAEVKIETLDVVELLVSMVSEANSIIAVLRTKRASQLLDDLPEELLAEATASLLKNSVQAIRLISELPSTRPRISAAIGTDRDLCAQVFKKTSIEKEMVTACRGS